MEAIVAIVLGGTERIQLNGNPDKALNKLMALEKRLNIVSLFRISFARL
jgi:hypothetical protein